MNTKIEIPKKIFEQMFFKDGGTKKDELATALTGQFQKGLPEDSPVEPNAEVEKNEFIKDSNGIRKVEGKTHESGGEKVKLEEGSQILSDHLKIGGDLARFVKKTYELKAQASDTYAKILDKYLKKIGLFKKTEEFEVIVKKLDKQKRETEDEATLALNQEVLMQMINEIGEEMKPLEKQKEEMFDLLFDAQEFSKKEKEETAYMEEGGVFSLANKYGISEERLKEIIPQYQDGSTFYNQYNPYFMKNTGYSGAMEDWQDNQPYKAEYELGDVEQTASRFKELAESSGTPYTQADLKDMNSLNALAGRIQAQQQQQNPNLVKDYGTRVAPTRQGLQYLVDNKLIDPNKLGIKVIGGKVARGSYDNLDANAFTEIENVIGKLPEDKKGEYAKVNYIDNLAYFRGINEKKQYLPKDEYEKYLEENKGNRLTDSNTFRTDKEGVYVTPYTDEQAPNNATPLAPIDAPTGAPTAAPLNTPVAEAENKRRPMGVLSMPDQTPMRPPSMLAPSVEAPRVYSHEYMHISPNQQLAEFARAQQGVQRQIDQLPDAQRAATLASLDANNAANLSKVTSETARFNAQADTQTSAAQAQAMTQQSGLNVAANLQNQQLMGRELEGYEADLQNYYNRINENQINNWKYVNTINRGNAFNPDVQFTGNGYEVVNIPNKQVAVAQKGGTYKKRKKKRF